jgi:hypothetical protein
VKLAYLVFAASLVFACVFARDVLGCAGNLSVSGWHLPSDKRAIVSEAPSTPYKADGLPDGTISVLTKYRKPGFRFRRPDGNGLWEFREASKISYRGRVFAIAAAAYRPDSMKGGSYFACLSGVVLYDEDGDGRFERPEDINGNSPHHYRFHVPEWVTR